jgi:hypothetical protein
VKARFQLFGLSDLPLAQAVVQVHVEIAETLLACEFAGCCLQRRLLPIDGLPQDTSGLFPLFLAHIDQRQVVPCLPRFAQEHRIVREPRDQVGLDSDRLLSHLACRAPAPLLAQRRCQSGVSIRQLAAIGDFVPTGVGVLFGLADCRLQALGGLVVLFELDANRPDLTECSKLSQSVVRLCGVDGCILLVKRDGILKNLASGGILVHRKPRNFLRRRFRHRPDGVPGALHIRIGG